MEIMQAKLVVESVLQTESGEQLNMRAVANDSPENASYSKFTPSASLTMFVDNDNLRGKIKPGQELYVRFATAD